MWPTSDQTEALLLDAKHGNDEAINQLMDRHRQSVRRLVQMRLDQKVRVRVDVSDVVQDVLIEANRRLSAYLEDPKLDFHLWIRQIAKDRIIDAHRRHRGTAKRTVDREQPLGASPGMDRSTIELAGQVCDPELTPAAAATQREIIRKVEAALNELSEDHREIIAMRNYEQLSNQEVAQALHLSEPAASMRYLRAVQKLREMLTTHTPPPGA